MGAEPAFTLGIEEEYLLVDVNTLEPVSYTHLTLPTIYSV